MQAVVIIRDRLKPACTPEAAIVFRPLSGLTEALEGLGSLPFFGSALSAPNEICPQKEKSRAKRRLPSTAELGSQRLLGRMFVFVDAVAHTIGFVVELTLVLLGQMAVVLGHVPLFVILQALLTTFQARGLSRSKLAILYAVGDAVLLVGFALINLVDARMAGIDLASTSTGSVVLLRSGGPEQHQPTHCKDCERLADCVHERVNPRREV